MLNRMRIAGCVGMALVIAAVAGCAGRREALRSEAASGSPEIAAFEGIWEGQAWEMPVHYLQGTRRVTLQIGRDGSWTASTGGVQCATGTASMRGGLLILGGARTSQDYCVPYSLAPAGGGMKAMFETSFKSRETAAMIGFERSPARVPQAAQATPR